MATFMMPSHGLHLGFDPIGQRIFGRLQIVLATSGLRYRKNGPDEERYLRKGSVGR